MMGLLFCDLLNLGRRSRLLDFPLISNLGRVYQRELVLC